MSANTVFEPVGQGARGLRGAFGRRGARRAPRTGPSGLTQLSDMVLLTGAVFWRVVTPPFSWWRDGIDQGSLVVTRCAIPAAISIFAFAYGCPGIEGGVISSALGAPDRIGAFFSVGAIREFVPWVTAMVVAGVAGTAITADLGARRMREELDALAVMGVDPIRSLIVPRVLALTLLMPLLNVVGLAFAAIAGLLAELTYNGTVAGYMASLEIGFNPTDLIAMLIKTLVFGAVISVVCAYKGYNASGGPEGVGRAVNQAVVVAFVSLWIFNFAFNATYQAAFPAATGLR
jgi:phospholipid/cholesterol/gamma-HCH transport system permease protein